jgi:hypothetical protein
LGRSAAGAPRRRSDRLIPLGRVELPARERYDTAPFLEKEGFLPLLRKARIAERYNCALLSSKGTSVVACHHLLDRLGRDGTRVLIAHDLDRAGLVIAHTLANDGRRYTFEHPPEMIDLGLRLSDFERLGLADEPAPDEGPSAATLRGYGASAAEVGFLCGERQRRVELNAMTSGQFVAWLEVKLAAHGAGKVVPGPAALAARAREAIARRWVQHRVAAIEREARAHAAAMAVPDDLEARVRAALAAQPALSWDDAVAQVVEVS